MKPICQVFRYYYHFARKTHTIDPHQLTTFNDPGQPAVQWQYWQGYFKTGH